MCRVWQSAKVANMLLLDRYRKSLSLFHTLTFASESVFFSVPNFPNAPLFQLTHMGFTADVIVWDFAAKKAHTTFTLHKVKVEALAFSPSDKYLVTLGGRDDSRWVPYFRLQNH